MLVKQPLIKIHGGKWYLADWIISLFPANYKEMVYIEPFLGGGSVLLKKEKSRTEYCADINTILIDLWREIKYNHTSFITFAEKLEYKQEVFEFYKNKDSPIATYVKYRMSRGGMGKTFSWSDRLRGGKPGDVNAWENSLKNIHNIYNRINDVYFIHGHFKYLNYLEGNCVWYLDPPYLPETRVSKKVYDYEMTFNEHEEMLKKILKFPENNHVLLSGYDNDMYNSYLSHWKKFTKEITNHSSQSKKEKNKN
jgi:DNA adenine methylase